MIELLKPQEIADLLSVSRAKVYTWIESGLLVASDVGRKRRKYVVRKEDFDKFLASTRIQQTRNISRRKNRFSSFKKYST